MAGIEQFLQRAESVLARVEALLPPAVPAPDWHAAFAFRWRKRSGGFGGAIGWLQPVAHAPASRR
jgi:predicted AAA+ superfamily ATPase